MSNPSQLEEKAGLVLCARIWILVSRLL
jgi:hypothetical protein